MDERELMPVEVYSFGDYAGLIPQFVAEMVDAMREPASFDQEATAQLGLDVLPKGTPPQLLGWSLVKRDEATVEQAGRHLDSVWGGQNGDVAAKFPGCRYWMADLDVPSVRFLEASVESCPDLSWEHGTDDDFWFVEVVDVPDDRHERLLSMTEEQFVALSSEAQAKFREDFEAPVQQVIVVTWYKIADHVAVPMRDARTRTLADTKYMVRQGVGL